MKVLLNKWTIVSAVIAIVSVTAIFWVFGFPAYFSSVFSDKTKKKQSRADNLRGALEYEFNMTKDPALNAIPEGIREKEIEQADSIVREQLRNNTNLLGTYSYVGPENLGGRTRALAYDLRYNGTTNRIILAGGISGGLFKSYDDGAGWVRKSPSGDLFTVSALAQDPRTGFQDIWYYAGGEFTGNSASGTGAPYRGKGVFKSADNGETWAFLPTSNTGVLESFDHPADYVQKIVVSPTTGFVYLAALNTIYRSPDGGATWTIVLTSGIPTFGTGMPTDIVVAPDGSFYAAFAGVSPSPMPGVWRSPSGDPGTWTKIAGAGSATSPAGWNADGTYGRVVLALAPSLPSRVYALYWNGTTSGCGAPAPEAEMYYWSDMTATWTDVSASLPNEPGCLAGNDPFAVQTGYDLVVAVKPDDPDTVFIGGTNAYRSTTTGATWTRIGGYASTADYSLYVDSHPDIHSFVFPPTSSTTMLCGNDGGIQRTTDNLAATVAWTQINTGYRTFQYYHVVNDPRITNTKVMGGAQDNGTTRNIGGTGSSFEMVYGGDGVSVGLSDLIGGVQYEYVGSQVGNFQRRPSTDALGFTTDITPTGESGGLFVTLFKVDPDNSELVYYANDNILYRTTSGSTVTPGTWTAMTGVAGAVGAPFDITAIALTRGTYSPTTSSLFFGTSDGRVFRLDNPAAVAAATGPVEITGAGFPAGAYVSSIAVDPANDDTIMVTFSNYGAGVTNIWWTSTANTSLQAENGAELLLPTWTSIESNLTLPSIRSSAIVVTPTEVLYFVGTSVGLYGGTTTKTTPRTAPSGGAFWSQEGLAEIGNAVVSSLDLRPSDNKLLVGTHGHGIWFSTFLVPSASEVSLSGRVTTADGRGIRNARITISGGSLDAPRITTSNSFGYYGFDELQAGETYTVTINSKRYTFQLPSRIITIFENISDIDFVGDKEALM